MQILNIFLYVLVFLKTLYIHINSEKSNYIFQKKPHIIFILIDDVGWNDLSFHGSNQIPTPNIDALAYNGVILNRHYVLPVCTPSRSSLMTSRYALRDGLQGIPLSPGETRGIPLNRTLMPEYFGRLGYATHLVGKWHLGYYTENHTPTRRGFESFYGYYNGLISYFNHMIGIATNDSLIHIGNDMHRDDPASLGIACDSGYFTDLITDEAVKIIRKNRNEKPLFLEISHLGAHANQNVNDPLEVPDMKDVNKTFPYVGDIQRRKYAGIMKTLDESVERVVKALNETEMLQDSIIILTSDNGAPTFDLYANSGSNYPLRGIKNTLFEGGVRSSACIFSTLIKSPGRLSEDMMHIVDWLPTLYAAAGGDVGDLGTDIDGLNLWPTIVDGVKSPRQSMILNIDDLAGTEAAMIGKHKLIKGVKGFGGGYYGVSRNDPSYPRYKVKDALLSPTGITISRLPGFISPSPIEVQKLRQRSMVQCEQTNIHLNCSALCLFDVQNDPCETNDLSKHQPEVVKILESFINDYRKVLMPQSSTDVDSCSFPENFNGTWMPWRKNEILF